MVTLEAKTGYIRAMVGGRDFEDSKFNRATQALRQPGSTFKPIVYAAAVEAGYPLSHVMVDDPLTVEIATDTTPWAPQNYDLEFDGPMTLRRALYMSRNIIAIKLGMELGEDAVISEATKFGLTTRVPPYPSIHIGSADVIPLEMIAAYTTFANLGTRTIPNAILRVEDRTGKILWQPQVRSVSVMDTPHAWLMTDALRDVVRHGTAVGSVGSRINFPAGGKTGTTNDGYDVWFIGFTPDLVTGIWIGFDQPKKIKANAQGGVLAAPAWTAMMREVYERRALPPAWPRPDGLTALDIDKTTGYKATPFCPEGRALHRVVHPRHRADRLLPHPLALRRRGRCLTVGRHRARTARRCPRRRSRRARRVRSCPRPGAAHRPERDVDGSNGGLRPGAEYAPLACGPAGWRRGGSCRSKVRRIERGALLIGADGRIAAVGPDAAVPRPADAAAEDFGDALLLPGLINTHTHLELTGLDGGPPEPEFAAWIRRVREMKAARAPEAFLAAARRGLADCWAAGVTTVADTGDSGAVIEALAEAGGSGIAYQEVFGPHPDQRDGEPAGPPGGRGAARPVCRRARPHRRLAPCALHRERAALRRDRRAGPARPACRSRCIWPSRRPRARSWRAARAPLPTRGATAAFRCRRRSAARPWTGSTSTVCCRSGRSASTWSRPVRRTSGGSPRANAAVAHCPLSNRAHGHGDAPLGALLRGGTPGGARDRFDHERGHASTCWRRLARLARSRGSMPTRALALCTLDAARALGLEREIGVLAPGNGATVSSSDPRAPDARGRTAGRGPGAGERPAGRAGHLCRRTGRVSNRPPL